MMDDPASAENIVKRARRVGVIALAAGVAYLLLGLSGLGGDEEPALVLGSVSIVVLSLFVALAGGVSLTIASRYPAVSELSGINYVCRLAATGIGVAGIVAVAFAATTPSSGLAVSGLVATAAVVVYLLTQSNRSAIRSPGASSRDAERR